MTDRIIRFSEVRTFQDCKRSWMNAYFLGLDTPEFVGDAKPSTATVGTYVHADLEHFYNAESERPGDWHKANVPVVESENFQKEWSKAHSLAGIMLEGYGEWLAEEGVDAGESTYGTEVELTLPFGEIEGDNVTLVVHIDRIVHDTTFDRWIVEDTKTVQTLSPDSTFAINSQLLTYALVVEKALGSPVAECRHNMLRRVMRSATAKPPFYGRAEITPSAAQLESQEIQLRSLLREIVLRYQALEAGEDHRSAAPAHPTGDCSWKCKFLPICPSHDDGSDLDGMRQALYITTKQETHSYATHTH